MRLVERLSPAFAPGGALHRLAPLHDALRRGRARPTRGAPHVRAPLNFRRITALTLLALAPCTLMALWNTGSQANRALAALGRDAPAGWRGAWVDADPTSVLANAWHGALYVVPAFLVALAAAFVWEAVFAVARRRALLEGTSVTALLFVLTLPPAIPLWQVALGMSFGVVVAKELFGGTGRNFVHPALAARAFVYFAYPSDNAGNQVWVAVDGYTAATPLTAVSMADPATGMGATSVSWSEAFLGTIPGSMGETSTLACLLGAALLVAAGLASYRVMLGMLAGGAGTAALLHALGSDTNAMFAMPAHWHVVTGGFAFGLAFLAPDPVTSAQTNPARWVYGFLVGFFCVVVRVLNPGYSESVMIVILLGNVFAPGIDWFVIHARLRRRRVRRAAA